MDNLAHRAFDLGKFDCKPVSEFLLFLYISKL